MREQLLDNKYKYTNGLLRQEVSWWVVPISLRKRYIKLSAKRSLAVRCVVVTTIDQAVCGHFRMDYSAYAGIKRQLKSMNPLPLCVVWAL